MPVNSFGKRATKSINSQIPHLLAVPNGSTKQLIVNGSPFLVRGAELHNSSPTSAKYMATQWEKFADMNINTLLVGFGWEQFEQTEGTFDFSEFDQIVLDARVHEMYLIVLWFGAYKNALSTYVPPWVKTNTARFPRAKINSTTGIITADALSTFSPETVSADAKAFSAFMAHLKHFDEGHFTVLMVQVENESGIIGDSRDRSSEADAVFTSPVPDVFVQFLRDEWESLYVDMRTSLAKTWTPTTNVTNTGWEAMFGKSTYTDELFMAYSFAGYLNTVAEAGKKEYSLPLYANFNGVKMPPGVPARTPGDVFPSGGALSEVLDVWQIFAPALDILSADVYNGDYNGTHEVYGHRNYPRFVPEQRQDDYGVRRIWNAIGSHQAIGASPFGIDTLEPSTSALGRTYGLIKDVSKILLKAQEDPEKMIGFYFDDPKDLSADPANTTIVQMGEWEITLGRAFGFAPTTSPGGGIVIQLDNPSAAQATFLLIGWGFQASFKSLNPAATFTGILTFREMNVTNGTLHETGMVFNGDETGSGEVARMPNVEFDLGGFPIPILIPAGTAIGKVNVYYITT
ncbi:glycoside hydrolase family 35 protein [Cadophora sp. DSE1049]|nr:glycoside hydrolase family 35 protein [Cadophora sp. DSE1049]